MRVLLVIDHFGSGGAQRQIVELGCGLKRRGHDVEAFIYYPQYDFFRPRLEEHGIVIHEYPKGRGFSLGVLGTLIALLRSNFDIVVSYLNRANTYAELAKLIAGRSKLVVSERTSYHDDSSRLGALARRLMHMAANQVVTNSRTQRDWLMGKGWLKHKVSCIYNGVAVEDFGADPLVPDSPRDLRLLAIGRIGPEKNIINLIRALTLLEEETGLVPQLSWVGARGTSPAEIDYCRRVDELLETAPAVRARWQWLGVRTDVAQLLRGHHALIHPSLYEGLPNVVCEALAASRPVVLSAVCDHPFLVGGGERGFLFDPERPDDIARAIRELSEADARSWRRLAQNARKFAAENLGLERMVTEYEHLFGELLTNGAGPGR